MNALCMSLGLNLQMACHCYEAVQAKLSGIPAVLGLLASRPRFNIVGTRQRARKAVHVEEMRLHLFT